MRRDAVEYQARGNLGQFLGFHLMQPSPVDAAFGEKLRRGDALQRFKHTHMKLGMYLQGCTQGACRVEQQVDIVGGERFQMKRNGCFPLQERRI